MKTTHNCDTRVSQFFHQIKSAKYRGAWTSFGTEERQQWLIKEYAIANSPKS
jgi:hypothetical protein